MRERNLLQLFLALNLLLAAAFGIYLFLSTNRQPKIVAGNVALPGKTNKVTSAIASNTVRTRPAAAASNVTNPAPAAPTNAVAVAPTPIPAGKTFNWQDVETADYLKYMDNLRLAGCPEDKIRKIVTDDINELIDKKRLKEAVAHDTP